MILDNENITTLEWNLKHETLMLKDGWKDFLKDKPKYDERILAVGDFESGFVKDDSNKIKRRMSLCKLKFIEKDFEDDDEIGDTFFICDTEYYKPTLINVRWWKPLTF